MGLYAAESDRLWLQPLTAEEHIDDFDEMMTHPKSMMSQLDREASMARLHDIGASLEKPWSEGWAILLRPLSKVDEQEKPGEESPKPKMIGFVAVVREGEIGYRIHPDWWGNGYMAEALAMFLDLFWQTEKNKKYDRLKAVVYPENIGSTKVLEKAGFKKGE
ncbi:hypothetical protein LCER1_G007455 [Lachnellula cervina]|uniref:N-acetyltransferase domain-containing protein n=1 Tax=Lachnellula cervina TaxID=1316786 RepID=A0A7D8YRZ7_9HELO|nr:hypothetical protein LCER1_G007455 [Lachnellula cervina]